MKTYIALISSLFLLATNGYTQESSPGANLVVGAATGVAVVGPATTVFGGAADELVFRTNHAFSQYDGNVANKILKDYRLPSSGVVTVEAINRNGVKVKTTHEYKNKKSLRIFLADLQWSKPKNGTISTNAKGSQAIRAQRSQMRAGLGAGVGLIAGTIVAIYINGSNSAQAGVLPESVENQIPIIADPDEIVVTTLISQ